MAFWASSFVERVRLEGWTSEFVKRLTQALFVYSLHTLGPNELYQAHLTPHLTQAQSSLDAKLEAVQLQNAQLAETVELQRQEIQQLLSGLESVIGDIEAAVVATSGFDGEGRLLAEAREMDDELKSGQYP